MGNCLDVQNDGSTIVHLACQKPRDALLTNCSIMFAIPAIIVQVPNFPDVFHVQSSDQLSHVIPISFPSRSPVGQEAIGASRVPELHGGPEGQYLRESTGRWRLGAGGHNLRWCLGMLIGM
jgi:hypothetical protein